MIAVKVWAPVFARQLVHLFSNNTTACDLEIWLTCTAWDITLVVGHVSGASLLDTADALSQWHLGPLYRSRVDVLLTSHITWVEVPEEPFHLSQDL